MTAEVVIAPAVAEAPMPFCKRAFDVVFSLLGLVLCAPFIAAIALAVRIDTPGSILFTQDRLGAGGRIFKLLKFRKFAADWGQKAPA